LAARFLFWTEAGFVRQLVDPVGRARRRDRRPVVHTIPLVSALQIVGQEKAVEIALHFARPYVPPRRP